MSQDVEFVVTPPAYSVRSGGIAGNLRMIGDDSLLSIPTTPGFYWWRESVEHEWRMMRIGVVSQVLYVHDIKMSDVVPKTLEWWKARYQVGEWIPVNKP